MKPNTKKSKLYNKRKTRKNISSKTRKPKRVKSKRPVAPMPNIPAVMTNLEPWVADVKKSGICPVVAYALGFRPVEANQFDSLLGFKGDGVTAGMVIPYRDPVTGANIKTADGRDFIRVKLEKPIKIGNADVKYLSPTNGGKHAYILPNVHNAILGGAQVIFTVGEKKAIAATLAGLPTIGLTDAWGWIREDKKLLPELQAYVKPESKWLVICNSDARNNPTFGDATIALAGELGQHKIRLQMCILPNLNASTVQTGKTGLDDYLLHPAGGIKNLREYLQKYAMRVFHANYPPIESELVEEIKTRDKSDTNDITLMLRTWCPNITKDMDKIAFEHFRYKLQSTILGIGIKGFNSVINAALAQGKTDSGHAVKIVDPEPWLDPVDGLSLVNSVKATIEKYLILPPHAADAMTLWVFYAHTYTAFEVSPILALVSAEKRCGKTTTLSVLEALVPRPLMSANLTPASLFRLMDRDHPTLLIDEADTFMKNPHMLGMINAGHGKQGAYAHRTGNSEGREYNVWGPKIIASIGNLSGTNQDRAIVINLRRKGLYEKVEHWRIKCRKEHEPLKQQLKRWALDKTSCFESADPQVPEKLDDRAKDNWRPLFAIADSLGGDWPSRSRESAIVLSADRDEDNQSDGTQLLGDIAVIFGTLGQNHIQTETILRSLGKLVERPWREYQHGKPITSQQLATLLRPFKIRSRDIRFEKEIRKGFEKADFEDAFSRYLPRKAATFATPATSLQSNDLHTPTNISDGSFVTMLGLFSQQVTQNVADVAGKTADFGSFLLNYLPRPTADVAGETDDVGSFLFSCLPTQPAGVVEKAADHDQEPAGTVVESERAAKIIEGVEYLRTRDSVMAGLIEEYGPCHIFEVKHNAFHTLVRGIVNQFVSKKVEIMLMRELETLVSSTDFRPEVFLKLTHAHEQIQNVVRFSRKASAILELARRITEDGLDLDQLALQDDDTIFTTLRGKFNGIAGIGEHTVKIFLVFYNHRLDVLLEGDKALALAIQDHYPDKSLEEVAECWHPYESIACWYLWQHRDTVTGVRA